MPSMISLLNFSTLEALAVHSTRAANTDDPQNSEENKVLPLTISLILLVIFSIVANIGVCVVVFRDRDLRESVRHLTLASLACADLVMNQVIIFRILHLLNAMSDFSKHVCVVFTRLHGILVYVSILHLFILSIDKYVAVFYPLRYAQKITVKRLLMGLFLVWVTPTITVGLAPKVMNHRQQFPSPMNFIQCIYFPAYDTNEKQRNYVFLNVCFLFGGPMLFIMVFYFKIVKVSWYQSNRVVHELRDGEVRPRSARIRAREMKWVKTIGIMIGGFMLCYLPIIALFLHQACNTLDPTASEAILLLSFANTLINPIIYCLCSRKYRKALIKLCSNSIIPCCSTLQRIRGSTKVTLGAEKQESKNQGTIKVDNTSDLSTLSISYSFIISKAFFQSILTEVLENENNSAISTE